MSKLCQSHYILNQFPFPHSCYPAVCSTHKSSFLLINNKGGKECAVQKAPRATPTRLPTQPTSFLSIFLLLSLLFYCNLHFLFFSPFFADCCSDSSLSSSTPSPFFLKGSFYSHWKSPKCGCYYHHVVISSSRIYEPTDDDESAITAATAATALARPQGDYLLFFSFIFFAASLSARWMRIGETIRGELCVAAPSPPLDATRHTKEM